MHNNGDEKWYSRNEADHRIDIENEPHLWKL